jgi:NAD(P)H-flavin reductase
VLLTLPIREVLPATPRARIVRLDLGGQHFHYRAGQAVMIARQHYSRRKPYSVASAPEDVQRDNVLELLIGVDDAGKPGPHLSLVIGAPVDVEGPVGTFTFPPDPLERRFVFIAGGTGIAPLRAMLRHALTISDHDIGVFYSARSPGEFAYESELRALAESGRIQLRQTVTRASHAMWGGGRGRLNREALGELVHDPATLCFVCGPPALVAEMPALLTELGIPRNLIRLEEWL